MDQIRFVAARCDNILLISNNMSIEGMKIVFLAWIDSTALRL